MEDRKKPSKARRTIMLGVGVSPLIPLSLLARENKESSAEESLGYIHAGENNASEAIGSDITMRFEYSRCIHSRFCVLRQPHVYTSGSTPWMNPDNERKEAIASTMENCPSGALQYHRNDGIQELPPKVNTVHIWEDGPIAVRANIEIDGKSIGNRATLCRCGQSKNKPFCDNSHRSIDFVATGEPSTLDKQTELKSEDGILKISKIEDGPLLVEGNLQICSASGRTITKTQKTRLCSCGLSQNKPFCDDSHITI